MRYLDYSIRVLIVDDMPAMRSILRGMVEEMGFSRIDEAEDGETAWQLMNSVSREEAFGLIVADWNMPGMSGVDLLRAVRMAPDTCHVPFIMVTSKGDRADIGEAARAGVTEYVVKPFNGAQLAEKIRSVFSA